MTLSNTGNVPVAVQAVSSQALKTILYLFVVSMALALFAAPANAQQTGEIAGQIVDANGEGVAGVSIEASGDVLPQPRTTNTAENGRYRFRLLPPGNYSIEFRFPDGSTQTRQVFVPLQQTAEVDMVSGAAMEEIVVLGTQLVADAGQGSLNDAISAETIDAVP
ncbi:MAG: carboxypeptidase-like regulatory domain-containing protein, partial [Woeseiaceae bacterium]